MRGCNVKQQVVKQAVASHEISTRASYRLSIVVLIHIIHRRSVQIYRKNVNREILSVTNEIP